LVAKPVAEAAAIAARPVFTRPSQVAITTRNAMFELIALGGNTAGGGGDAGGSVAAGGLGRGGVVVGVGG
ncbi:hypothetical protein Tco_1279928, partial [Tanacetum coccineum]